VAIFVDQNFADPNQNSWADTASTLSLFNDVNAVYTAAGLGTFQVQAFGTLNSGSTSLTSLLSTFSSQQANFGKLLFPFLLFGGVLNYNWLIFFLSFFFRFLVHQ